VLITATISHTKLNPHQTLLHQHGKYGNMVHKKTEYIFYYNSRKVFSRNQKLVRSLDINKK